MAEKQFAYYEFNAQKKNIEKGTLLFIDGENIFVKQDIIPNINVGEIDATRLYFLLPYGTYTGLNPFFTIRNPKGWTSGLIAGVKITLNTTEPKTYSAVYIDLDKIGYTKIGGLHAIGLGFLENGSFITYDAVTYTVDDGVNNYENTSADVYEEIYSSIENTFIAYADRVIQSETDIQNHEGRITDIETTEIPRIDSDIEDLHNEKVNKAGDTMEGNLNMGGNVITGANEIDTRTLSTDDIYARDTTEIVIGNDLNLANLSKIKGLLKGVNPKDGANMENISDLVNMINTTCETKVDKTQKIIGIELQGDILIDEFKATLGNATQSVAGLLSAEDKTHLDGLVALLETSDGNNVVDTIGEILQIFQNYPEGADLVTVLQGKVDKVAGKGLSTNDFTDLLKAKLDSLLDGTQYYDKTYIDALKDKNGWESELLGTLSNNGTIALSVINQYDEIQMYAKDTLGVIDNENIRPSLMQSGDSVYFFDDTQAFIMVDTVFGFYAPVGYTLQVVGLKYTNFTAEEVSTNEVGVTVQDKLDEIEQKTDKLESRQVGETIITYNSGAVVSVSSDNVVEAIEYDVNGEVEKVTSTYADGKVYEETYTKDVNGNITKIMKVEVI